MKTHFSYQVGLGTVLEGVTCSLREVRVLIAVKMLSSPIQTMFLTVKLALSLQ